MPENSDSLEAEQAADFIGLYAHELLASVLLHLKVANFDLLSLKFSGELVNASLLIRRETFSLDPNFL